MVRLAGVFRILFVVYCVEAGALLVLAPWSLGWDRTMLQLPVGDLRTLLLTPVLRGGVSGFGLVHLVWGAHDLDLWLTRRRIRREAGSAPA